MRCIHAKKISVSVAVDEEVFQTPEVRAKGKRKKTKNARHSSEKPTRTIPGFEDAPPTTVVASRKITRPGLQHT